MSLDASKCNLQRFALSLILDYGQIVYIVTTVLILIIKITVVI